MILWSLVASCTLLVTDPRRADAFGPTRLRFSQPAVPRSSSLDVGLFMHRGNEAPAALQSRKEWFAAIGRATAAGLASSSAWGVTPIPASAVEPAMVPSVKNYQEVLPASVCDPSVSAWRNPSNGRTVYLLGTAHISSSSAELAGELVKDVRPDAVFVELDAKRAGRALPRDRPEQASEEAAPEQGTEMPPPPAKKINPFDLRARALDAGTKAVGNAVRGMYQKLESEGFKAGDEFVLAVREGLSVGSTIVLGDRDVDVTLKRLTEALARTDIRKLAAPDSELEKSMDSLLPDSIRQQIQQGKEGGDIDKDQFRQFVETMKAKENVRTIMASLKKAAPELYQAMVAERDEFMAEGLDRLNQFSTTVAIMGMAHVDGVESNLQQRGWKPVTVPCSLTL